MSVVVNEATLSPAGSETATFTKWMVGEGPGMAGVVGGAAGEGSYVGKVLDYQPGPTTVIAAIYQFEGSRRPFTALVHVEQTGLHGAVSGVVIDGWGKGNLVTGGYEEISCEHDGVTTACWRGTLDIARDSRRLNTASRTTLTASAHSGDERSLSPCGARSRAT